MLFMNFGVCKCSRDPNELSDMHGALEIRYVLSTPKLKDTTVVIDVFNHMQCRCKNRSTLEVA